VGVYWVPVAVTEGYTIDVKKGIGVEDVIGDGNESGVELAIDVGVFIGVDVGGGTIAVWVWKKYAAKVPTLSVKIALISAVEVEEGTACPPQEASSVAVNSIIKSVFRALFIFTSKWIY